MRIVSSLPLALLIAALVVASVQSAYAEWPKLPKVPKVTNPFGPKKPKNAPAEPAPEAAPTPVATSVATPTASAPAVAPGTHLALVTLPPLPDGAGLTYAAPQAQEFPAYDPVKAEQEATERAQALAADLRDVGPIQDLPLPGTAEFARLRAEALAIVQRRFAESRAALEADTQDDFAGRVTWVPDFSPAPRTVTPAQRTRARDESYDVAFAITHLDRPRFLLAYAAAFFALDPDSALGAENAASAIVTSGERLYPTAQDSDRVAPYRADAAVVYRYALACSVESGKWTLRSLGILINLGSLYVDMKDAARARPVLLAALAFAPDSQDAAVALASSYDMQGRPQLSLAVLEDRRLARSGMYATASRGSKNMQEGRASTELTPDDDDETIEAELKKFDAQEFLTAADFVAQIDQSERNRIRAFVNNLLPEGSYRAPDIDGLTQYSTVAAINRPGGIQALSEFASRLGSYGLVVFSGMMQQSDDTLARLGMSVTYDVDINDVMAHPEKYKDRQINATVTGADQAKARAEAMRLQAEHARRELDAGRTDALLAMGAQSSPILNVYRLKPYEYANPIDVMIQQYNASVLAQKMHAYNTYFFSVNNHTRDALREIAERADKKRAAIAAMEEAAMAELDRKLAAAAKAGQDTNSPYWRMQRHNIHRNYGPQYNEVAEFAWKEATQAAGIAYERKIKRRAERFYYDVFRHIALISDPAARDKKNREFERILHWAVYQGLTNAATAFGSYEYKEEWDCRCDVGSLVAQAEAEDKELDRIRFEAEQRERLRFASGDIPATSPLYQKLDAYGTDLDIPFIPSLSGRISVARTTLNLSIELPNVLAAGLPSSITPKGSFTFNENAFTGATTRGGSLEVAVKLKEGDATLAATLNVKGSISMDGKGVVSDYTVTGSSRVNFGMGPHSVSAGAEIGYTPGGGLTSDASTGVTSSLTDTIGRTLTVTLETSARRGTTFTMKSEMNLNPESGEVNKFFKDAMEESGLDQKFPIDTSIKRVVWNGKFTM